jgi:hypothetical protein
MGSRLLTQGWKASQGRRTPTVSCRCLGQDIRSSQQGDGICDQVPGDGGAPEDQRWAKGPIDRSSDTDSIFRIQSVDVKFRFLYWPIVSVVLSSDSLIDRSCFLVFSSDFSIWQLCWSVLSPDSLINRSCFLVLSSDFFIVQLCQPVLSKKSLYRYFIKIKNRLKIAAAGQI